MKKIKSLSMLVFTFILTGFISIFNVKADATKVTEVNLEVKNPVAGTSVVTTEGVQTEAPFVAPMEAGYVVGTHLYRTSIPNYTTCEAIEDLDEQMQCFIDADDNSIFNGTIVEGQNYYVEVALAAAIPDYEFDDENVVVSVNGKTTGFTITDANWSSLTIYVPVTGVAASTDNGSSSNIEPEISTPAEPSVVETETVEEYWKGTNFKANGKVCSYSYTYDDVTYTNYPYVQPMWTYDENGMLSMAEGKGEVNLQQYFPSYKANLKFEMDVKTTDLDANKTYVVSLKSDYVDTKKKYTGAELNKGITVEIADAKSKIAMTIYEEKTGEKVKYKFSSCDSSTSACNKEYEQVKYFDEVSLYINDYKDYPEIDKIYNQVAPDGVAKLNVIKPSGDDFSESMISAGLPEIDGYYIYGYIDEDGNEILTIGLMENNDYKSYPVKFEFATESNAAKEVVAQAVEKLKFTWDELNTDYSKRFAIEDLESINFLYNTQRVKDDSFYINKIVNYSSQIHKVVGNANIDFIYDVRAGGSDSDFTETFVGPMNIVYNGVIYRSIEPIGFALTKIIYVPDNTEKTRDAFIKAAKERITSYLKGVDVEITYGGKLDDLNEAQYSWESASCPGNAPCTFAYHKLFDFDKTTGEWYKVKIGEKEYKYFIVADSSKMATPEVATRDVETNIYIATDSFDTPLDSKINVQKLSEDSDEYKALAKKLNIIKGLAFDLNLYSSSLDMYITKLADGSFKVYIPIDEETAKKDLVAAYVKDDGTIEEHPIVIENGYAVFETNHFSTYSIVEAGNIAKNNPKTGDNVFTFIIVLLIGIAGLASVKFVSKKKN